MAGGYPQEPRATTQSRGYVIQISEPSRDPLPKIFSGLRACGTQSTTARSAATENKTRFYSLKYCPELLIFVVDFFKS